MAKKATPKKRIIKGRDYVEDKRQDGLRKAKSGGWRISGTNRKPTKKEIQEFYNGASNGVYMENRINRIDKDTRAKKGERFEQGGEVNYNYERGKNYPVKTVSKDDYEKLGLEEYPNFSKTGSISGMKKQYYGKDALLVKCGNYIYNVTSNPDIYFNEAYEKGGEIESDEYKKGGKIDRKKSAKKTRVNRTKKAIAQDKNIKALHGGKRISAEGNVYYEYRENRQDSNRTKKLAKGGKIKLREIEDETVLMPYVIAEPIAETVAEITLRTEFSKWDSLSKQERESLDEKYKNLVDEVSVYLVKRANTVYTHNKSFEKDVKGKKGREVLNTFMEHWCGLVDGKLVKPISDTIARYEKESKTEFEKGGEVGNKYYVTYVSLKSGHDLYSTDGDEESELFIGNFKNIEDAKKEAEKIGLERLPIHMNYSKGGKIDRKKSAKKTRVNRTKKAIAQDKNIKALHAGKRESESGKIYYESRPNRSDEDRRTKLARGGFVGKGELVWKKLNNSERLQFLYENFTPEITPRSQEILVGKDYNFLPKNVKIKIESKYANVEDYAKGGKLGFEGLAKKVAKEYEGDKVKPEYQDEYGKRYDKEEAKEVGQKVAAKVYREQQGMMEQGGNLNDDVDEELLRVSAKRIYDEKGFMGLRTIFLQLANTDEKHGDKAGAELRRKIVLEYQNKQPKIMEQGGEIKSTLTLSEIESKLGKTFGFWSVPYQVTVDGVEYRKKFGSNIYNKI